MSDVQGMAYVLEQLEDWNKICTPEPAATFSGRLMASNESFNAEGMTIPYWGNLWALRTYQTELGMDEIGRAHVCQSLMRISYAVFCLKKKKPNHTKHQSQQHNTTT